MGKDQSAEDAHNKGQEDRAAGKNYTAPHSVLADLFTFGKENNEHLQADNDAYKDGWNNNKSQIAK